MERLDSAGERKADRPHLSKPDEGLLEMWSSGISKYTNINNSRLYLCSQINMSLIIIRVI